MFPFNPGNITLDCKMYAAITNVIISFDKTRTTERIATCETVRVQTERKATGETVRVQSI